MASRLGTAEAVGQVKQSGLEKQLHQSQAGAAHDSCSVHLTAALLVMLLHQMGSSCTLAQ